jgi:hypothetical protein
MSEPGKQPYLLDIAPLLALLWESARQPVSLPRHHNHMLGAIRSLS